jgi:hypothetical protein
MSFMSTLAAALIVTSLSFSQNGMIPSKFTCDGDGISPSLHIDNIPDKTISLALIVDDPDAPHGTFTHWVAWNIDPAGDIAENTKPGEQGKNGFGKTGYGGPCPPSGTHHYHFKVYALDIKLKLPAHSDRSSLEHAMKGHVLAEGELIGLYKKRK